MYKITYRHKGETEEHDLYVPGKDNLCLTSASLPLEEGKAGELTLGIPDDNTAKAGIVCLTDEIIVYRDSEELFRGRCVTEQSDFNLTGTLTVEGILTYFYDTYFPPFNFQGPPEDLLKKVIDNHNSFVDKEKQFQIGTVTVEDANNYIARSSESYNRTIDILNDKFIGDSLGGYFRARVSGGARYLDYLKTYGTSAEQTVELGKNILDLAIEVEYGDLITAILPLGAKDTQTDDEGNQTSTYVTVESVNSGDIYIRDQELIKKYGFICECVEWQDVTEPVNLKTKALAYLAQKSLAIKTLTIKAVDLYLAGEPEKPFELGDLVKVKSTPHGVDQYVELSAIKLDLLNPANDTLTFGSTGSSLTQKTSSSNRNMAETVGNLAMIVGRISSDYVNTKTLVAEVAKLGYAKVNELEAEVGKLGYLKAEDAELKYATAENLSATNANIQNLNTDYGNFKSATVENLQALSGNIQNLDTKKLNAEDAKLTYANIDFSNIGKAAMEYFYAQSGLIKDVTVGDQTITGELVGVTIRGDRLVADSVQADKLVIKGEDGLYYKLNVNALGETTAKSDSKYQNGLDGSALIAKSVTAEKVSVKDLVAFGATIGGVNIGDSSIYSGVKTSALNTTRGFYLGKDGQAAFGDTNNYLKYFQDTDGTWKLAISADRISIKSGANLGDVVDQIQDEVSGLKESGGFNWNLFIETDLKCETFSQGYTNGTIGWWQASRVGQAVTTDDTGELALKLTMSEWAAGQYVKVVRGQKYTISCDIKLDSEYPEESYSAFKLYTDVVDIKNYKFNTTITKQWKRISLTWTPNVAGFERFHLRGTGSGDTGCIWIKNIKFEKGSVATAWTPAESEIYGQTGADGSKMAVAQLTYTGGYWAEYNESSITAAINNGLNGVNSTGNWSCSNASDFKIGDIAMCLCQAKDTGRYTYLLLKIDNVTGTTIAGPAIGQTSGKNGETGGKGDKGDPGSDGKSLVTLITNYSYAQSAIDTYAKYGYSGGWTVINSEGVNVGDTVLIRVTNTTKNGYSFIIGRVTAVNSATLVTCTSMGLLDKGDTGATGKPGIDFSQGKMLYTDPTFNNGVNGISVYNNRGSGYVTISRTTKTNDNPIPEATYNLVISNTGAANPSLGGFCFKNQTRCNAIFVYRFIAWIPSGYTVNFASNSAGGEYAGEWLTSNVGDGNYREYVYRIQCGRDGSYSTTGYFYLDGTPGTSSNPVKWWLAYATCYDMTATSDVLTLNTSLNQTKEEIKTLATAESVNNLTGRVSTAESTITQHAKDISLRVTTETFNNLQIGGRNLFLRTADFSPKKWYQNATITKDGNEYYAAIRDTWNGYVGQLVSLENTEYTVSFYAKTSDGKQYGLEMKDDSGNNLAYFTVPINSSEWKRYEHSFTPTKFAYTPKLYFLTRQSTGIIYLKQIKLEKGNKATDWTPAPEDQINVGEVTSQLNSELKITGNSIDFTTGHFTVNSTNLTISSDGTLTAKNGVFSGRLEGATGTFSGSLSAATGTFAGTLSAAGGTFKGSLSAAGGTFTGTLSAAGGTFKGSLSAATGTFGGTVNASGVQFNGNENYLKCSSKMWLTTGGASPNGDMYLSDGASSQGYSYSDIINDYTGLRVIGNVASSSNGLNFLAVHTWMGNAAGFGVGAGGENRGIYDHKPGGSNNWIIYRSGNTTYTNNTSDERTKEKIGIIPDEEAIAMLNGIKPYNFVYKDGCEVRIVQNGFMAQNVRDLLRENDIGYRPYLLIDEDNYDLYTPEEEVIYGLDYSKFVPLLLKGWQMHEKRIAELERKIAGGE